MKFAVLGGGGCFGINLAKHLLQRGHEVIGTGRSALKGVAHTFGVQGMGYRYLVYSIGSDNEFIAEWLEQEQPEVIVNFAAHGEGAASFKARNWKYFYATNTLALVQLTEMLLGRPWLKKFVQVSTSELYGSVERPAAEDAPLKPSSPYSVSKVAFDLHLQSIARTWGFPAVIVRPSNCITPGQQMHRVVPKTFLLGLTGRKLELHGGGMAKKSYMAADDLSSAIEVLAAGGALGDVYNAGPEHPVRVCELVRLCAARLGMALEDLVEIVPDRTGQDACYWIDSGKLKALGWEPRVRLEDAVAEVHLWVQNFLPVLVGLPLEHEMRA